MSKYNFPYIALFLGMTLMLVVSFGGQVNDANITRLPLLTLLIICEFAFFVTAIGAYVSLKQIFDSGLTWTRLIVTALCGLSAVTFLVKGIAFWPL